MKKVHIVSDTNNKSIRIKKYLLNKIKTYSIKNSSVVVVIGGDGFMLQTLKKYNKFKKPFYGINSGSYGFLMNKFNKKKVFENIFKANKIIISQLIMRVKTKSGNTKIEISFRWCFSFNTRREHCIQSFSSWSYLKSKFKKISYFTNQSI